jgi:histidinol-phosphate/aromatic aminotransferase/cobyric acid decarboxylase-like protein
MKARKIVDEMDSYVPGKSQGEIAEQFGLNKDEIIKLGSNENPWGPSPKAMEAIKAEIKSINSMYSPGDVDTFTSSSNFRMFKLDNPIGDT